MLAANASLTYICRGANPTDALVGDIWGRTPSIALSCESNIRAAALSLSGHSVALVEEKQISIWSTQTGQCCCKTPIRTIPKHLSFSQDEHALVFVEGACDASLWLWKQGYPRQSLSPQHSAALTALTCNNEARFAVTADTHGLIRVWRWKELEEHGGVEHLYDIQQPGAVSSVMFQAQGRWFATASDDQTARVYEAATGTQCYVFAHHAAVSHMLFSHDGHYLITASKDQTITIWNLYEGQQLTRFICAAQIQTLLLSPDDAVLATTDEERWITLWLWRTEDLEEEIAQSFPLDESGAPLPARAVLLRPFDVRPKEEPL